MSQGEHARPHIGSSGVLLGRAAQPISGKHEVPPKRQRPSPWILHSRRTPGPSGGIAPRCHRSPASPSSWRTSTLPASPFARRASPSARRAPAGRTMVQMLGFFADSGAGNQSSTLGVRRDALRGPVRRAPRRARTIRLAARHTKIRREGYPSDGASRARNRLCHPHLRCTRRRRMGDRLTMLPQRLDVQRDRFGDEFFDLVAGAAGRHAARKIGYIRAPGVAFLLDHDDVLSHHSAFPTCRPAARSIQAYRSALHHSDCPPPSPFRSGLEETPGVVVRLSSLTWRVTDRRVLLANRRPFMRDHHASRVVEQAWDPRRLHALEVRMESWTSQRARARPKSATRPS